MSAAACLKMTWNVSKQKIINLGLLETITKTKKLLVYKNIY
jgi:hypothetical protein